MCDGRSSRHDGCAASGGDAFDIELHGSSRPADGLAIVTVPGRRRQPGDVPVWSGAGASRFDRVAERGAEIRSGKTLGDNRFIQAARRRAERVRLRRVVRRRAVPGQFRQAGADRFGVRSEWPRGRDLSRQRRAAGRPEERRRLGTPPGSGTADPRGRVGQSFAREPVRGRRPEQERADTRPRSGQRRSLVSTDLSGLPENDEDSSPRGTRFRMARLAAGAGLCGHRQSELRAAILSRRIGDRQTLLPCRRRSDAGAPGRHRRGRRREVHQSSRSGSCQPSTTRMARNRSRFCRCERTSTSGRLRRCFATRCHACIRLSVSAT